LMLASTIVKAYRWSLLVRQSHMDVSFRRLLGSYLVGAFFSTVLPTSVGGDAVRAVDTAAKTRRVADSTSSVLLERAIGLITVMGAGSIFALFMEPGKVSPIFILMVHAMSLAGLIGLVFLRQGWFMDPIAALLTRLKLAMVVKRVKSLQAAFSEHLESPLILLAMFVLSIIANALTMGATYLVLTAVTDKHIPVEAFVPMIALATTAELVPISPAALGVKESAYVFFLGMIGVPNTAAGVIAIIMRVLVWALALLGGIVFMLRTISARSEDEPPPDQQPPGERHSKPVPVDSSSELAMDSLIEVPAIAIPAPVIAPAAGD
ncbi:MAG: flippase-like domain-containing protein, partial [Anaerolineae bacterium]|nr:flippase-like domain-containing protein [Anaerolineae bacterium]